MPIEFACANCGKRYRVDDRFAGKKVKCKGCGNAIGVPASTDPEEDDDLSALSAAAMSTESMASFVGASPDDTAARPQKPVIPQDDEYALAGDYGPSDSELPNGFGPAIAAAKNRRSNRSYRLLPYPGTALVDSLLPWLLAIGCLVPTVWAGVSDIRTGPDPKWVPIVEYSVVFLLFLGLVVPVTTRGLRWAASNLHFPLPESPTWRMVAVCAVPMALATAMYWQIGEAGIALGIAVGILFAWPLIWLIYSLHWAEAIVAWMSASLFLLAGAAVVAIITVIISIISAAALSSQEASKPVAVKPAKKPPALVSTAPASGDATTQMVDSTTQPGDGTNTTVVDSTTQPATAPADVATAVAPAVAPATQSTGEGFTFVPVLPPKPASPSPNPGDVMPGMIGGDEKPTPPPNPLVESVTTVKAAGPVETLIGTPGATAPIAVQRTAGDQQKIIVLDPAQEKALGMISYKPDAGLDQTLCVLPDGSAVVRLTNWPKLSIQETSLADESVITSVPLADSPGTPMLIGLSTPDIVAIHWPAGVELWNLKTGTRGRQIVLPNVVNNGLSMSPDGKQLAVLTRPPDGSAGQLLVVDLAGPNRPPRKLPITQIDPKWSLDPVSLNFSPDSSKVTAVVEHDTGLLILTWNVASGKVVGTSLFPPGTLNTIPRSEFKSDALNWIDANTWLLYGHTILDAGTGKSLGSLDLDHVTAQRSAGDGVIDLVSPAATGEGKLTMVKFNAEALAKLHAPTSGPAK